MGTFLKAIQVTHSPGNEVGDASDTEAVAQVALAPARVTPLPALQSVPAELAREGAIGRLSEQLAALTAVQESVRILISGCRAGDGASTLAAGIAIDISQRLGLATVLVDAHLRHPTLHHLMLRSQAGAASGAVGPPAKPRSTDWPRLDLTSVASAPEPARLGAEFSELLRSYPVAIIDLGVVRLDPSVLSFTRPGDPTLLCVRYGHTRRSELFTSVRVLNAAQRPVTGVIFNGVKTSIPKPLRRVIGNR